MTQRIMDVSGERYLEIEGDNLGCPGSVFVAKPGGGTLEFDRATFIQALMAEFGLCDPLETLVALSVVPTAGSV